MFKRERLRVLENSLILSVALFITLIITGCANAKPEIPIEPVSVVEVNETERGEEDTEETLLSNEMPTDEKTTEEKQESSTNSEPKIEAKVQKPTYIPVTSIEVLVKETSIEKNTLFQSTVKINPNNATNQSYTISSSDESILRKTENGWLASKGGTADIIAVSADGIKGRQTIKVIVPTEAITLDVSEITIDRYNWKKINHTIYPADATDKVVSYSSSDEKVATVNNDGSIYAVGAGTAVIKCVSSSGSISSSCTVNVIVPVSGVHISVMRSVYKTSEMCNFNVQVFPEDATDKTFALGISNTNAELINSNALFCKSGGNIAITATASNGVSGYCDIRIIDLKEFADEAFQLTNIERQNNGLPEFTRNSALTATAELRAKECTELYSHTRPNGSSCLTAFAENGITDGRRAENIAQGQRTPNEVVTVWMNSPGHRGNILNPNLSCLGMGVEMDSNGRLSWVMNFTD